MKYEDFFQSNKFTVADKDYYGNTAESIFGEVDYDEADGGWKFRKGEDGIYAFGIYKNVMITLACHKDSHEIVDLCVEVDPSLNKYNDAHLDDGDWRAYLPTQTLVGNAVISKYDKKDAFEFTTNGVTYAIPLEIDRVAKALRDSIAEARDYASTILGDYSD